jgi:hypothetical protein
MLELIGVSFVTSLLYAGAALLLLFYGLRWLDYRNGRPWKDSIKTIRGNAHASAIYYAARWLGACILIGLVMSR